MSELRWLTANGDETLTWDSQDAQSVEAARARFVELKEQGYEAYEADLTRGKKIAEFDPTLAGIVMAPARKPAMAGGPSMTHA